MGGASRSKWRVSGCVLLLRCFLFFQCNVWAPSPPRPAPSPSPLRLPLAHENEVCHVVLLNLPLLLLSPPLVSSLAVRDGPASSEPSSPGAPSSPSASSAPTPTPTSSSSSSALASSAAAAGAALGAVGAAPVTWVGEQIGSCHYVAAQFAGKVYHVSDTVLLQSGTATPFVCRIERMMQKGPRKVMFVRWCFRPHDVPECSAMLKRQPYSQELFVTDVVEENDLATILGRCYILPPQKYAHLPAHLYDSNVFCCSLFLDTGNECFRSLQSVRLGPLYSEPPMRAPRLNMPAIPLSGAVIPGFNRGPRKKRRNLAQNGNSNPAAILTCTVEDCDNVCWSKVPAMSMQFEWGYKPEGIYVCDEHARRDRKLRELKRPRSLSVTPEHSGDEEEDGTAEPAGIGRIPLHKRRYVPPTLVFLPFLSVWAVL